MAELVVLCYHSVSPTWPAVTNVRPSDFEEQIAGLLRRGWSAATLVDALTAPRAGRTFVVTFDDAHRSVLDHAAPILERLHVPATLYVPTDYAGTTQPMGWDGYDMWLGTEHEHDLLCLDWDELRMLADRGWEIGSHTCSHPRLTTVPDDQLAAELVRSREICERELGGPCHSVAYPYSDVDERVLRAARAARYELGVTVLPEATDPLPLAWPRVIVALGEDGRRVRLRAWRRRHAQVDAVLHRARAVSERLRTT